MKNPALAGSILVDFARVALAEFHQSPAPFELFRGSESTPVLIYFDGPDDRSKRSLERKEFVEKGAIVMAGLLLSHFEGKQITRVAGRGQSVDYFVGETENDERWILEVSGTDLGSAGSRTTEKRIQLEQCILRWPPFSRAGFVSVTRFAPPAVCVLEWVPPVS